MPPPRFWGRLKTLAFPSPRTRERAMDIGAWLRDLGLGQYEQAFRENDIDGDV
ncbi:MAG: hypothetical protein E5X59_37315, partial [Mesorhizobium sp.]